MEQEPNENQILTFCNTKI